MADLAEEAQRYGWNLAVFKSSKELMRILRKAIDGHWTQARFIASVQGSDWYRSRPESARQAIALRHSDPKEYKRRVNKMKAHIMTLAQQLYGGRGYTGKWMRRAAEQAVMLGWSDEEIRFQLGEDARLTRLMRLDQLGGEAGRLEEQIQEWEGAYGVKLSGKWTNNRVRQFMMGHQDEVSILQQIQKMSKARYRNYADEIERGATIAEIAEPYRQSMSKILEINPESLDVFDDQIQKALTNVNAKEGQPEALPLWQFEQRMRYDPRWDQTNNARESMMGAGRQILSDLGLVT